MKIFNTIFKIERLRSEFLGEIYFLTLIEEAIVTTMHGDWFKLTLTDLPITQIVYCKTAR